MDAHCITAALRRRVGGARRKVMADSIPMNALPSSAVTFLFTDFEGSTSLMQPHPEAIRAIRELFAATGAVHDRERA